MSAQLRLLSQQLGKPINHYTMPVTVTVTQTVVTVYELDYMRYIRTRLETNNEISMRTNFILLSTNVLSSITNTSPTNPH